MALIFLTNTCIQSYDEQRGIDSYNSEEYYYNTETDAVETHSYDDPMCYVKYADTTEPIHKIPGSNGYHAVYYDGGQGTTKVWVSTVAAQPLQLNVQVTHLSDVGADDGQVMGTVTGGVPPYKYANSLQELVNSTNNYFINLAPGSYVFVAEDSLGSQITKAYVINSPGAAPTAPGPTIQNPQRLYFSQNPVIMTVGASAAGRSVIASVMLETYHLSGIYKEIAILEREAEPDGSARFNISSCLDTVLSARAPEIKPALSSAVWRCTHNLGRFYIKASERNEEGIPGNITQMPFSTVLLGGLPNHINGNSFFTAIGTNTKMFLTWKPQKQQLHINQPEFLYCLIQAGQNFVAHVDFKLKGADGAEIQREVKTLFFDTPNEFKLIGIPLFGIPYPAGALYLDVQVTDGNQPLSPDYRYLLNRSGEVRTFLFRNSLGVFDTLFCTGQQSSKLEVQKSEAELYDGTRELFTIEGSRDFKVSTGWVSAAYLEYLQELFLSKKVFRLDGTRYVPVIVKSKELNFADDFSGPNGLTFEYSQGEEIRHYAKL